MAALATRTTKQPKPFPESTPTAGTPDILMVSYATLLPLIHLGLLDPVQAPDKRLAVSALGHATWRRFLHRGGQFPKDLT